MPSASNRRVTRPLRPNNKMAAMARENGGEMDEAFARYVAVHATVGEDEAERGPQKGAQGAHLHGSGEDQAILAAISGLDVAPELSEAELPRGGEEPLDDDANQRPGNEHQDEGAGREQARQEHWILGQRCELPAAASERLEEGMPWGRSHGG